MHRGNAAGVEIKFDRDSRRIVPVDEHGRPLGHDPDRYTTVTPKDMGHSGGCQGTER